MSGEAGIAVQALCALCGEDLEKVPAVCLAELGLDALFCEECAGTLRNSRSWADPIPDNAVCEQCREHRAVLIWSEHGIDGLNHGAPFEYRCQCCCLRAAIGHAERELAALPERIARMKAELAEACGTS